MQWIERKIWTLMKMAMAKWQEQLIQSLFKYHDTCLWLHFTRLSCISKCFTAIITLEIFSSVWCDIVWHFKSLTKTKPLPYFYRFSSEWALLVWIVKWPFVMLEKSQCGHLWDFYPEWVILCLVRDCLWFEAKLHWSHWWDFYPTWLDMWIFIWCQWTEE